MNRPWLLACVTAEAIGMTAAAGAARGATAFTDHVVAHDTSGLLLVVLGGLVEGGALGVLQALALDGRSRPSRPPPLDGRHEPSSSPDSAGRPRPPRQRCLVTTGAATPLSCSVLPGAALLGAVMGVALGATQAWALRHRVRHPGRWVAGSAAGWSAAMPVIFLGATSVGATWPWWIVVPIGTLTGLAAGLALGIVSGTFLDTLVGPAWHHRLVLGALLTFRRTRALRPTLAGGGLVGLGVHGARTGRRYRFPVQSACWGPDRLVVLPAHPERKIWRRNWVPA